MSHASKDRESGPVDNDDQRATTLDDDDRVQASVPQRDPVMYPEPITLAELTHERTVASSEFGEQDRIRRAVRDLIAGGLLYLMELRIAAGETPVDPLVFGDHNGKPFQAATIYRRADRA